MGICIITKYSKMVYPRLLSMPRFIGCLPLYCLRRATILQIYSSWYCLSLIALWKICVQEHGSCRFNQSPIEPLGHTILFWCFGNCFLVSDSFILQILLELVWGVFSTVVSPEGFQLSFALPFDECLPLKKTIKYLILGFKDVHPCVFRFVVCKGEEIFSSSLHFLHFPTHVWVHEFQSFCRLSTAGKWAAMVFPTNAGLTKSNWVWYWFTNFSLAIRCKFCSPRWPYRLCHSFYLLSLSAMFTVWDFWQCSRW